MSDRAFRDRRDAGRVLARLLDHFRGQPEVIVLGLPRGGVPVAYEVATALGVPLDVFVVRKLGVPGHDELAMGAIAGGGVLVVNDDVVRGLGIRPEAIREVADREGRELVRREQAYREGRPAPTLADRTVVLVDDGLATGASMRAAVSALREHGPARPGSSSPCPCRRSRRAGRSKRWSTRWSARSRPRVSVRSARPTGASPRPRTMRFGTCCGWPGVRSRTARCGKRASVRAWRASHRG